MEKQDEGEGKGEAEIRGFEKFRLWFGPAMMISGRCTVSVGMNDYFAGLPLPRMDVESKSQIFNPAWLATKTRKDARMAAVLKSLLVWTIDAYLGG